MFERFTDGARAVVKGAVRRAEQRGDAQVEPGHLLLALLDAQGTKGAFALTALGVRREAVVSGLDEARRRGGVSAADAEALAGLGIDVTEIVSRVEEAHGEGALARGGRPAGGCAGRGRGTGRSPRRRRRSWSSPCGWSWPARRRPSATNTCSSR